MIAAFRKVNGGRGRWSLKNQFEILQEVIAGRLNWTNVLSPLGSGSQLSGRVLDELKTPSGFLMGDQ